METTVRLNNQKVVEFLIQHGADVNKSNALSVATNRCLENMVKILIKYNADKDKVDNSGETPLCVAIRLGCMDIVKYLVENGADVNKGKPNGSRGFAFVPVGTTPLHIAVDSRNLEIIKYLVEHGADVKKQDSEGTTPLMFAKSKLQKATWDYQKQKYRKIIDYLISKGAK